MKITGNNKNNRIEGTSQNDIIFGLGGNDKISGRKGSDAIQGGDGNDKIGGGEGHDVLTGGSGADSFVFRSRKAGDSDLISDFKHGTDKLELDNIAFTKIKDGDLSKAAFFAGEQAHDSNDRFIYDKKSGQLFYDDDGSGSHAQRLIATLVNHQTLSASDIFIL